MSKLIKSSFYKLFKDATFRITLIIGAALAVFMCLIYFGIDVINGEGSLDFVGSMCNGYSFYTSSLSPTQNFGLTVPINLIVFTIGEFNCGTIRNKIIAGNKKSSIYFSLLITGAIFTISLMAIYFGLSVGLSTLIGGFEGMRELQDIDRAMLYQYPLMALCTYIFIVSLAVLVSTSIRNIGGAMPIVIITIMFLYFVSFIPSLIGNLGGNEGLKNALIVEQWLNPMHGFGSLGLNGLLPTEMKNDQFIASLITPLYWSVILTLLGIVSFERKDVK